jgi:hypothetical protein
VLRWDRIDSDVVSRYLLMLANQLFTGRRLGSFASIFYEAANFLGMDWKFI